ncbi:MAG: 2-oxo acid dehydrogenase subunit E2 [candidate division WOR-3 bacterium]|nr:2-oxo acid dehydrogenase subunit E2 [candidate division WOR-3 bacterium]MCX7947691.1 2-oxo acid dehydrogenase subunit E2 [candidate division WOR-3 bacterium]MDW8150568.1 dihydrolipoamide acetyltransferase family protein [candidate division WOR-3 bacterium]
MAIKEFKMPEIAESVHEGEIGKILVKEGDYVKREQPLLEVLTDKVNTELPSPYEGYVIKILVKEGDIVTVGTPLLIVGDSINETVEKKEIALNDSEKLEVKRPLAAPAVRKLARELGIDLNLVRGTGPSGRITRSDVLNYVSKKEEIVEKVEVKEVREIRKEELEEVIPIRGIRRKIAEHLRLSKDRAVHTLHVDEIDMTEVVKLREKLKRITEKQNIKLTYLPFIIKAVATTLKKHPYFNAIVDDEKNEIVLKKYYNIGVAVDTPDGLIVPVVKNVDKKSIIEIAREIQELSEKAREGKLTLEDLQDGTFSITNVGSIGGLFAFPVIDYPRVAILGTHKIRKVPIVNEKDEIVIRDIMYVSLSFDHRVVDGAEAARFTRTLSTILENPDIFILEAI